MMKRPKRYIPDPVIIIDNLLKNPHFKISKDILVEGYIGKRESWISIVMTGNAPWNRSILEEVCRRYGFLCSKKVTFLTSFLICNSLTSNTKKMRDAKKFKNCSFFIYDEVFSQPHNFSFSKGIEI